MTAPAALAAPPMLPGPPIFGHALQFLKDPIALLKRGLEEKGPILSFRLGNKSAVAVFGPENNRFFFDQTDKLLSIREGYPFFIKMFSEGTSFFAEPAEYKEQRSLVVPHR